MVKHNSQMLYHSKICLLTSFHNYTSCYFLWTLEFSLIFFLGLPFRDFFFFFLTIVLGRGQECMRFILRKKKRTCVFHIEINQLWWKFRLKSIQRKQEKNQKLSSKFFCEGRNLRKIADFVTPSLYQWTTMWQIPTIFYTPFFTSQSFPPIMSSPCSYIFNQIL